jgi:hypothetical protein
MRGVSKCVLCYLHPSPVRILFTCSSTRVRKIVCGGSGVVLFIVKASGTHWRHQSSLCIEDVWGSEGIAPPFLNSSLDGGEWLAWRPILFTSSTHCIRGWMGPRAGLDAMENRKISHLCLESNPHSLIHSPQPSHYYYYYYFTTIWCSAGGSRTHTDTDKERLYIKGTIQNKVHTMQIQDIKSHKGTWLCLFHCTRTRTLHITSLVSIQTPPKTCCNCFPNPLSESI